MRNIPAELSTTSSMVDIFLAYDLVARAKVDHASEIVQSEIDSITKRDMRAGRRARTLVEVLMDMVCVSGDEIDFAVAVQKQLRAAAREQSQG